MGGNVGNEHHPLAAGQYFAKCIPCECNVADILDSYQRGMCDNRERCADEPF